MTDQQAAGAAGRAGTRTDHTEIARAESERGELVLRRRRTVDDAGQVVGPTAVELRANGVFVMDSVEVASEQAMARAALDVVEHPKAVVVGGLGLGYTMHEVLADPRVERCVVVEIEPALVGWLRDGTVPDGPARMADERLSVVVADVAVALAEAQESSYDLVLLDVDNGPDYLVHAANAALYEQPALADVRRVLRPGGALVVWSATASAELEVALRAVFDRVEVLPHDVLLQERDERYWLFVATVDRADPAGRPAGSVEA